MCLIMLPGIVRRERREQREQGADAAAGRGTHAAQAAAGQRKQEVGGARWRRGRDHRGREASTRGDAGAMECGGEMKGEASASTIGKGASARSFEGGASASTISKGATPRSAKGGASASTIAEGAGATRAKQTRTTQCRRVSRSSEFDPGGLRLEPAPCFVEDLTPGVSLRTPQ